LRVERLKLIEDGSPVQVDLGQLRVAVGKLALDGLFQLSQPASLAGEGLLRPLEHLEIGGVQPRPQEKGQLSAGSL
jgi:hypothetical protein